MITLARPPQQAKDVFALCTSRVRDPDLKARLDAVTSAVVDASVEFDNAAMLTRLHRIARQVSVGGVVSQSEMEAVYTQRMAKKGAPGRDVYDALITSSPQGKCPLCGWRTVSTLDHHLPKAHYPALAVAPLNLVPACSDCNKAKLATLPTCASEEPLHPYYDDIDGVRWLYAEVVEASPAALRFLVRGPTDWGKVLTSRVERQFRTLGLGRLYSSEAADELLGIRHQLISIYDAGGAELVRTELEERAESYRAARRNGWRAATHEALAASEWFCAGGFEK